MVVILSRSQCINILLANGPPDVPDIEKNTTGVFVPPVYVQKIFLKDMKVFFIANFCNYILCIFSWNWTVMDVNDC